MRGFQPFIPITGRLGKPILKLRLLGLTQSYFSKSIASKYSGLKQQRLNFPEFVLLKSSRGHLHVNNIIQILNNPMISALPSTVLLNLNLSFFWNQAVQRLGINAIPLSLRQPQAVKLPTSFPESANVTSQILVNKTQEIKELRKILRLNSGTANQDANKPWFVNLVMQKFAIAKSQHVLPSQFSPNPVAIPLSFRQSPTVEISTSFSESADVTPGIPGSQGQEATGIKEIPRANSRIAERDGNKSWFVNLVVQKFAIAKSQQVLLSQSLAYSVTNSLSFRQSPAREIPANETGETNLTPDRQSKQIEKSTIIKTRSALTVEQTSHIIQRVQTLETQSMMQSKKAATYSLTDLNPASHHIRTRKLNQKRITLSEPFPKPENLVLPRQVFKTADKNQSNEKYSPYSREPVREFAQSKTSFSPVHTNQENGRVNDSAKLKSAELGMPMIDVNRLADQVYQVIERKIKVERQRRGML